MPWLPCEEPGVIRHQSKPEPVAVADRAKVLADPGFGRVFTDHMAVVRYSEGKGWHSAEITARKPLMLDPASAVLHYAQEIFEGLKAYKLADGSMATFRPEANARRFRDSARRLAMPELPEELFVGSIDDLIKIDRDWFPTVEGGSLYIRPFMFANEVFLGREAVVGISLSGDHVAGGGVFQKRCAGGFDLGVGELYARGTGWHGRCEVRRQLCDGAGGASRSQQAWLRSSGVSRRG